MTSCSGKGKPGIQEGQMSDKITSPTHYVVNGLECFDVMKAIFGVDAVEGGAIPENVHGTGGRG